MANPKISAVLSFATAGIGGVKNDIKAVSSSVDGASSAVEKFSKKISSIQKGVAFQSVVTAAGAVKSAFGAVTDVVGGAASAIYDLAANQAAVADKVGKTAALMGMQAGELQALRSAGMHAGMSLENVDSALEKFSVNTGRAAAGEKTQIELFNALGVATRNADGSIRSQTDLLADVANAYSKLSDSADRNRVSQELFGRSSVMMSALLKDGSAGIRSAVEAYNKTGSGFTESQAKSAADFNDNLQEMQEFIGGIRKDLTFALVPAFADMFKSVSGFIEKNRPEIDSIISRLSGKLPEIIDDVKSALPAILSAVSGIASAVASVVDFTGPWVPLLTAAGAVISGGILTAVGAVGVAVSTVGAAFGAAVAAAAPIVGVVALVGTGIIAWGSAIKSVYDNFDMLKSFVVDDVFGAIVDAVKRLANEFIDAFAWIADGVSKIPLVGEKLAGGSGDWWRSHKFDVGASELGSQAIPPGESNVVDVAGPTTSSSSSLTVDFKGVPKGVKIVPSANFDYGNIDYSAGYAFGG